MLNPAALLVSLQANFDQDMSVSAYQHISYQQSNLFASVRVSFWGYIEDFVGLSAIAARPFAPTRIDPADRIHGWLHGNMGFFLSFFSFHYRLPKVGTEISKPPLKPRGPCTVTSYTKRA
jgi:hypothetical protein